MRFFLILLLLFLVQCRATSEKEKAAALNNIGLSLLQVGKEDSAILSFKGAIKINDNNINEKTNYLRNLGIAFKQKFFKDSIQFPKTIDSAKYYFLTAAKLNNEKSFQYLINMADVFLIEQKIVNAIACLENAWEINKNDLSINNVLGLIYLGENGMEYFKPAKGLKYNLIVERLNPSRLSKYVVAKNYFYLKDYPKAEIYFDNLFNEYPQFTEYLMTLIIIEKRQGKDKQAEKHLEELKIKDPSKYKILLDAQKNTNP